VNIDIQIGGSSSRQFLVVLTAVPFVGGSSDMRTRKARVKPASKAARRLA